MIRRYLKIALILTTFLFTTGFLSLVAFVGPATTIFTSGNIYKASAQLIIDQSIKKTTGKNSFMHVKGEFDKKKQQNEFNEELRQLVEKRIKMTRKKLNLDNIIK